MGQAPYKLEELTSYTKYMALRNTLCDSELEQESLKKRREKNYYETQAKQSKEPDPKEILKLLMYTWLVFTQKNSARAVP